MATCLRSHFFDVNYKLKQRHKHIKASDAVLLNRFKLVQRSGSDAMKVVGNVGDEVVKTINGKEN